MSDLSSHDLPPPDPNNFEEVLEREYSSTAPETLSGLAGYDDPNPKKRQEAQEAFDAIPGDTPEAKLAAIEQMPNVDARFKREVGPFVADIARGWKDDEQKVYESLKLEGATRKVETEFGQVLLKNIRHGQETKGGQLGKHWGDAEFDSLPSITPQKIADHQEFYDQEKAKFNSKTGDPNEMTSTTFTIDDGRTINLQVARSPQAGWGGKDYHFYANWDGGLKSILEAKLPTLSLNKRTPVERPMSEEKYSFHLEQIRVNLDEDATDAGKPMGRMKFEVRTPTATEEVPASAT